MSNAFAAFQTGCALKLPAGVITDLGLLAAFRQIGNNFEGMKTVT